MELKHIPSPTEQRKDLLANQRILNEWNSEVLSPEDQAERDAMQQHYDNELILIKEIQPDIFRGSDPTIVALSAQYQAAVNRRKSLEDRNESLLPVSQYGRRLRPSGTQNGFMTTSPGYRVETFVDRLEDDQRDLLEQFAEDLMSPDGINEFSSEVSTPKEVAELLGVSENEARKSFGMLRSIQDGYDGSGHLEFRVFDLSKKKASKNNEVIEIILPPSNKTGQESGIKITNYLGRVHFNADGKPVSIVLDVVPPVRGNAAYVIRGDDGRLDGYEQNLGSKIALRQNGARQVMHVSSGMKGVINRINKALTMPFGEFLDKKNYRLS